MAFPPVPPEITTKDGRSFEASSEDPSVWMLRTGSVGIRGLSMFGVCMGRSNTEDPGLAAPDLRTVSVELVLSC